MAFFQAVQTDLRNYSTFGGAARRPEFWWFALFVYLGSAALATFNVLTPSGMIYLGSSLAGFFAVAMFLPFLAVTVRRLRDAGYSWGHVFWLLLPIAGLIVLIVLLAQPSRVVPAVPSPAAPAQQQPVAVP